MKVMKPTRDPLMRRLQEARRRLDDVLASGAGTDECRQALESLEIIEKLASRRRRRRSLVWLISTIAAALALALLFQMRYLPHADVTLVASTDALVVDSGSASRNVLADAVAVSELLVESAAQEVCVERGVVAAAGCRRADALTINSLVLNTGSTMMLRRSAGSVEVRILKGRGQVAWSCRAEAQGQTGDMSGLCMPGHAVLDVLDAVRFRADEEATLQMAGFTSLLVGARNLEPTAEQSEAPAIVDGRLTVAYHDKVVELGPTDVLRMEGLSESALVARVREHLTLTLVARSEAITRATSSGAGIRNLMPTWYDRASNSQLLKLVLALVAVFLGPVLALRDRLVAEAG